MFNSDHPLFSALRRGLYHSTDISSFKVMQSDGFIFPNANGRYRNTFPQSANSCCRKLNSISLFDFATPRIEDIFDNIVSLQWSPFLYKHRPVTILIGFNSINLSQDLISNVDSRKREPRSVIIKDVEVCYPKPIPTNLIRRYIIIDPDVLWNFRFFEQSILTDQDIDSAMIFLKSFVPN
jgi:hypothetical protein